MNIIRRKTKVVKIGKVRIGGDNPIAIQSMAKTKTSDIEEIVRQIGCLERAGCEIIRLAVKDQQDAKALKAIKQKARLPLVADIHFDWRLALQSIDSGADKIRLNPGNIYKKEQIREIANAAKLNRIPIRVGINSGSLRSQKAKASTTEAMVKSAFDYIKILEGFKFYDIVVSLKASNILGTIEAYRRAAKLCDYPFHLGVTATGLPQEGAIKSAIAQGILLSEGIGDTIRISLTDRPQEEVNVAKIILEALGLRSFRPQIISCPTCGRCEVDLIKIIKQLENKLSTIHYPLSTRSFKIAIMGCVVNGPGEAKEADIGVAFGKKQGLLFKNGFPLKKISVEKCVDELLRQIGELRA